MDFQSFSRRALQALCKKNKIPANITNVAMAQALEDLTTVEGMDEIQDFMTPMKTGVVTPKPVRTSARISARRTAATRRTATKQEENNGIPLVEIPDTPAPLTGRKVMKGRHTATKKLEGSMVTPGPEATGRKISSRSRSMVAVPVPAPEGVNTDVQENDAAESCVSSVTMEVGAFDGSDGCVVDQPAVVIPSSETNDVVVDGVLGGKTVAGDVLAVETVVGDVVTDETVVEVPLVSADLEVCFEISNPNISKVAESSEQVAESNVEISDAVDFTVVDSGLVPTIIDEENSGEVEPMVEISIPIVPKNSVLAEEIVIGDVVADETVFDVPLVSGDLEVGFEISIPNINKEAESSEQVAESGEEVAAVVEEESNVEISDAVDATTLVDSSLVPTIDEENSGEVEPMVEISIPILPKDSEPVNETESTIIATQSATATMVAEPKTPAITQKTFLILEEKENLQQSSMKKENEAASAAIGKENDAVLLGVTEDKKITNKVDLNGMSLRKLKSHFKSVISAENMTTKLVPVEGGGDVPVRVALTHLKKDNCQKSRQ